jgi:energy-coupling factor transporter ATP-binding protein EcfA2
MAFQPADDADRERRLDAILGAYLEAQEQGQALSPTELCQQHPDLAADLALFFGDWEHLNRVTAPLLPVLTRGEHFPGTERFAVLRRLGGGAMGTVYLVRDKQRDGLVALKVLRHLAPDTVSRFKQEFRGLTQVVHPNLVALHELIAAGHHWFITLEYVDGTDFLTYLRALDVGPEYHQHLCLALRQLAEGTAALHQAGLLHRDLKPSNVLVRKDGLVKLVDFGLVSPIGDPQVRPRYGYLVGTALYMAPEQAAGRPLSPASDWYSVGVMLYQALTGHWPFDGSPDQVIAAKQNREPPAPATIAATVPDDLNRLCAALLKMNPADRPTGEEVLHRLGGLPVQHRLAGHAAAIPGPTPFIGRSDELALLNKALVEARASQGVVVFVHGPSGIGKTTLLQQFLGGLRGRGGTVILTGRCHERESIPYKALDGVMDALLESMLRLPAGEVADLLPPDATLLARVFPPLAQLSAIRAPAVVAPEITEPSELRRRAFLALRALLARLAERGPLVLAIDDLQWGDLDSGGFLVELTGPPAPPPLLLVGCYRSEDVATSPLVRRLREADRQPGGASFRDLELGPLAAGEARELAQALGGPGLDAGHAATIAAESGGIPFLAKVLARHLVSGGEAAGKLDLARVLGTQIDELPQEARDLLEVVAVAGRPLHQGDAFRSARLGAERREVLTVLQLNQLVRTTGPAEQDTVETYHLRIREAVHSRLNPETLRNCHLRLAQTLEAAGGRDLEAVALYFQGAGEAAKSAAYAVQGADQAAQALAFDQAARLYRLALDLGAAQPLLRRRLADALANAGQGAAAAREYLTVAGAETEIEAVELRRLAAVQYLTNGRMDEGTEVLDTVLASVGLHLAKTPRRALLSLLWQRLLLRLRGLRFRIRSQPLAPIERLRLKICRSAFMSLSMIDNVRAAAFATRFFLTALRLGDAQHLAQAFLDEAMVLVVEPSQRHRSAALLRTATKLRHLADDPYLASYSILADAFSAFLQGHWRSTVDSADQSVAAFRARCPGAHWEITLLHLAINWALYYNGELAEMSRRLPPLLRAAAERGSAWDLTSLRLGCCNAIWLVADDPEGAHGEIKVAMDSWPGRGYNWTHLTALQAAGQADLYAGDGRSAWQRMQAGWPALEASHFLRVQIDRIGMTDLRARCALGCAAAGGDMKALLRVVQGDVRALERENMAWANSLAQLLRAGIAALRSERPQAVAHLQNAAAGFDAVDMRLHACVARRRLGQLLGGDTGRALVGGADAWLRGQQVRNPERWTNTLAPWPVAHPL